MNRRNKDKDTTELRETTYCFEKKKIQRWLDFWNPRETLDFQPDESIISVFNILFESILFRFYMFLFPF